MSIGYIGLGNMGGALARRLALQQPVLAFDANEEAVSRMAAMGATTATCLEEIAETCDLIFLCLPTSEHVREVIFGAGGRPGLASSAKPGTVIVDQTTGDPTVTRAMATELVAIGIELIDAPVSAAWCRRRHYSHYGGRELPSI